MNYFWFLLSVLSVHPCFSADQSYGVGPISALTAEIKNINSRKPTLEDLIELRGKAQVLIYHAKSGVPKKYVDDLINAAGDLDVKIFDRSVSRYDFQGPVKEAFILSPKMKSIKLKDVPDLNQPIFAYGPKGCRWGVDYTYDRASKSILINRPECAPNGIVLSITYRKIGEVEALKARFGEDLSLETLDRFDLIIWRMNDKSVEVSCAPGLDLKGNPATKVKIASKDPKNYWAMIYTFNTKFEMEVLQKKICSQIVQSQSDGSAAQ